MRPEGPPEDAREEWLNGRTIVDDILPLGYDAGLVLRTVTGGRASWRLLLLHRDGSISRAPLPVASGSRRAHLHGDVRGATAVFLVSEYGETNEKPLAPPRLIVASVAP